jgi:hypothetical protein
MTVLNQMYRSARRISRSQITIGRMQDRLFLNRSSILQTISPLVPTDLRTYFETQRYDICFLILDLPACWLCSHSKLDSQDSFIEAGQRTKCRAGEINVFGAFGASCASVDDSDEDAFLGAVAD